MDTASSPPHGAETVVPTGSIDPAAEARLECWMRDHVAGFAGPLAVRRFPGGQSNPTFALDTPMRRYVLRRKPPGAVLSSAHAVDREFRVMECLGRAGFPVPEVFGLCEDDAVIGSTFYVMAHIEGRIEWDPKLPRLAPKVRAAIYSAQAETLATLHAFDPAAIGLADFGRSGNYYARQVSRWTRQYHAAAGPANADMKRLIEWLPDTLPPDSPAVVVHGDYRLDNLVLHAERAEVIAVLDWELSTLGDAAADFTYFLMSWVLPVGERSSLRGLDLAALGIPKLEEAAAMYLDRSPVALAAPLDWYLAYNLFRFAAILQGVAGRARSGQANNERALQAQARVGPIAATAWEHALRAGAKR